MTTLEAVIAIAGLALVTVLSRAFFMIPERELPIPPWLREAMRFAPLAAIVAILAPEILMTDDGHFIRTWKDARLFSVAAAALAFWHWRDMLGTILAGSAVLLALRLGLGW